VTFNRRGFGLSSTFLPIQLQSCRLSSTQYRLDNIRRQQRQSQDPTHVGLVDLLGISNLANGNVLTALQHVAPAERPGDSLDDGVVDMPSHGDGSHLGTVGREDEFPTAAPADRNRHTNREGPSIIRSKDFPRTAGVT
jgi:hypothetical protein